VFNPASWQVAGLYHSGRSKMSKLNGPTHEHYEDDEGIAILAIEQKTRSL
jgi:hypothetical protein